MPIEMWYEDIDTIILKAHDWFVRHPLGATDEGYDHFHEYMQTLLEPYSTGDYRNYN